MIINTILIIIGGFAAGFISSISGGGSAITMPILFHVGLDINIAIGTNKLGKSFASLASAIKYGKSGKIKINIVKRLIPISFIGAIIGSNLNLRLDDSVLKLFSSILISIVALYSISNKKFGCDNNYNFINNTQKFLGILLIFAISVYEGFLGVGATSFFIFIFIKVYKLNYLYAVASAKIINFITAMVSLSIFLINGKVNLQIGILLTVFMILGSKVGTKLALKNEIKIIKPIFIIVLIMTLFTTIFK